MNRDQYLAHALKLVAHVLIHGWDDTWAPSRYAARKIARLAKQVHKQTCPKRPLTFGVRMIEDDDGKSFFRPTGWKKGYERGRR